MNRNVARTFAAIAAVLALTLPAFAGDYPLQVARNVMMYMALAITWDMLLRSGQISFGIAGLVGLGAYASILGVVRGGMPGWLSIPFAGLFSGIAAFLIGFLILRLRHTYFSIVTLALGEIFRIIIQNMKEFSGGPEGIVVQEGIIFGGKSSSLYFLTLAGLAVALGASYWFEKSRVRFALTAIRNNEISARSSGVDIFRWLLVTFVVTSAIQGMIGGIFAMSYGFASPDTVFSADFTLLPLAMALLGGIHSTVGPILGGLLLGLVAEWLKLKIPYGHLVVYGIMIIFVILFMPQGLLGVARKAMGKTGRKTK
ncbi:MAG TPA: branched-chain amino acid ABC transporter permease [Rectinemataceae bacterium]|nr:branched-chain amino acid ABC transporter permease [Rectinemataceae bacterium]